MNKEKNTEINEEKEEKIPRILVFCKAAVCSDASGCRGTRILLLRRLRRAGEKYEVGSGAVCTEFHGGYILCGADQRRI